MSRVELLEADAAPLAARPFFPDDRPASPIVRALAQVPELLEVAMPFVATVFEPSSLDLRTKEIVVLRVSAKHGCRYCVQTHTVAAWDAGLSVRETRGLCSEPPPMGAREDALIAWCDALCAGPEPVPPELTGRLRGHFPEHELVELTLLAGATIMLNRFCTALELPTSAATLERLEAAGTVPS
jgi:AhpD family alkylhydroperoxidase